MQSSVLFFCVVHLSLYGFDHCNYGGGCRFEYCFDSDTTSTPIVLLSILVVSVDLVPKLTGPQNLKGVRSRSVVVGITTKITSQGGPG